MQRQYPQGSHGKVLSKHRGHRAFLCISSLLRSQNKQGLTGGCCHLFATPDLLEVRCGKTRFFQHLFSFEKGCLENFWKKVEDLEGPKLSDSPLTKGSCPLTKGSFEKRSWKEKTILIIIHGDGVEYHNRDSLPKSCQVPETFQPIWVWLKWSFEALAKGYHPTADPCGEPLKKGVMEDTQGQPLHPKHYRCFVWSMLGDQKFFSNTLDLPHWASHFPCHQCDCQNFDDAHDGKHVKEIRVDHQKVILVSHKEALKKVQDALENGTSRRAFEKRCFGKSRKAFEKRYSPNLHFARSQHPNGEGRLPSYPLQPWCAQTLSGQCLAHHGLL